MSTNSEFSVFEALDLAPIKTKLMHAAAGQGWSERHADAVEAQYRRFLYLMKKYPDSGASPTVDVDTFWHHHILDTMKYARDCEAAFGYFLHHDPHAGTGERMREPVASGFGAGNEGDTAWCAAPGRPAAQANDAAWCAAPGRLA